MNRCKAPKTCVAEMQAKRRPAVNPMNTPATCYHCALPVPASQRFTATVLGQPRAFCCPGCQAVAEAIVAGGLQGYYQHRDQALGQVRVLVDEGLGGDQPGLGGRQRWQLLGAHRELDAFRAQGEDTHA